MSWQFDGACRGADPDLFFGPDLESATARRAREARAAAVCATCPVRATCESYANAAGIAWGVWGGLGEDERRAAAVAQLVETGSGNAWRVAGAQRAVAGEKKCTRCRKTKTLGEFPPDKRASDGRASRCHRCVSIGNVKSRRNRARRQRREATAA